MMTMIMMLMMMMMMMMICSRYVKFNLDFSRVMLLAIGYVFWSLSSPTKWLFGRYFDFLPSLKSLFANFLGIRELQVLQCKCLCSFFVVIRAFHSSC